MNKGIFSRRAFIKGFSSLTALAALPPGLVVATTGDKQLVSQRSHDKTTFIGIGTGGLYMMNGMIGLSEEFTYVVMDKPHEIPNSAARIRIPVEMNDEDGHFDETMLLKAISRKSPAILVAGLGHNTGTSVAPVAARLLTRHGNDVIAVVTKPYLWESGHGPCIESGNITYSLSPEEKRPDGMAQAGIERLVHTCTAVIVLANEKEEDENLDIESLWKNAKQTVWSLAVLLSRRIQNNREWPFDSFVLQKTMAEMERFELVESIYVSGRPVG